MRGRIVAGTAGVTTTILLIVIFLADSFLAGWLRSEYDKGLIQKAKVLITLVKEENTGVEFDFADEFMPEFERDENPEYFQLWQENSGIFERSNSLEGNNLFHSSKFKTEIWANNIILPDNRKGRSVEISFLPQIQDKSRRTAEIISSQKLIRLVIAKESESLSHLIFILHSSLIIGCTIVVSSIIILVRLVVRRGLQPLADFKKRISELDIQTLNDSIALKDTPEELGQLVISFNKMLKNIDSGYIREKRFSSNVAHELRTPISELRTITEVALNYSESNSQKNHRDRYIDISSAAKEMQGTIDKLLALAKSESGLATLIFNELPLCQTLNRIWKRCCGDHSKKVLRLMSPLQGDIDIFTSTNEFEMILKNLLENAYENSPEEDIILVSIHIAGGEISLSISNAAIDLCHDDLELMFDRFWRKDPARTSTSNAGLGMSLIRSLCQTLNITIEVSLSERQIFTVTLSGINMHNSYKVN